MPTKAYEPGGYGKIRYRTRAHYDRDTVFPILDSGLVAHVGFVLESRPMVIPMAYVRIGETIYIHGAKASRIIKAGASTAPVCLTVTHVDGLVAARSAFNHSMNYRSVVVHGELRKVTDEAEKLSALIAVTNYLLPDRWDEVRPMTDKELNATGVLAIDIETAAAKIRQGPPMDEDEDYELPIWAGVLPVQQSIGDPENDPRLLGGPGDLETPASVAAAQQKFSPTIASPTTDNNKAE